VPRLEWLPYTQTDAAGLRQQDVERVVPGGRASGARTRGTGTGAGTGAAARTPRLAARPARRRGSGLGVRRLEAAQLHCTSSASPSPSTAAAAAQGDWRRICSSVERSPARILSVCGTRTTHESDGHSNSASSMKRSIPRPADRAHVPRGL
jgi:hypothetical protein